jgi:hypothetical protein
MPDLHAPICKCGSLRHTARLVSFPLRWSLECCRCGSTIIECNLKTGKPKPAPKPAPPIEDPYGFWGIF